MKRLYNINGLDLEQILTVQGYQSYFIERHLWKYYYFLTKILNKYSRHAENKDGYYRVSSEELKNKLGKIQVDGKRKWAYLVIKQNLEDELCIIKSRTQYDSSLDKKFAYYKIKDNWLDRGWSQVKDIQITDELANRMERVEAYKFPYSAIERAMYGLTIDFDAAVAYTQNALDTQMELRPKRKKFKKGCFRKMDIATYSSWMHTIHNIQDGTYYFDVALESSGRVTNTFTSVPRELRQFLRINNKPLVEVDVANCQPLLFTILLEQWAIKNKVAGAADIAKYRQLCQEGKFYDYLIELMEENGEEINEETFKVDFFSRVFFSTEKKQYKWRTIFTKDFPHVSQCITALKADGYNKLAIKLQKQESDIMILDVCNSLYKYGNSLYSYNSEFSNSCFELLPLHDAIFCAQEQVHLVKEAIYMAFSKYGLKPTLKEK